MVLLALVARLTFQGKPITHAYVDSETVSKLQQYGQSALTAPTSATQDDWLVRGYKLKEFNIKNGATFSLSHNAILEVENLNANNATINLDSKDGENIQSVIGSGNLNSTRYGDEQFGVGNNMSFDQSLTQAQSKTIENVAFIGNLNLTHSSANISYMKFSGNIKADNTSPLHLSNTQMQGNIESSGTLGLSHSSIQGKVNTQTLNANNTTFIIDVDLDSKKANCIQAGVSASGSTIH